MTVEIISWSIFTKVWDRAGIKLTTPGSAVRLASVARYVTDCSTHLLDWVGNTQMLYLSCFYMLKCQQLLAFYHLSAGLISCPAELSMKKFFNLGQFLNSLISWFPVSYVSPSQLCFFQSAKFLPVPRNLASLVMSNGDPQDRFFYPTLTLMIDSYTPSQLSFSQSAMFLPVSYVSRSQLSFFQSAMFLAVSYVSRSQLSFSQSAMFLPVS